jgi:hypothetical protein
MPCLLLNEIKAKIEMSSMIVVSFIIGMQSQTRYLSGVQKPPSLLIIIHLIKIIEFSGLRVLEVYIKITIEKS